MLPNNTVFRLVILAATSLFYYSACVEASGRCWWPNGAPAKSVSACNSTSPDSACCYNDDLCTNTGYCLSSVAYYYYRAACTDRSWESASCPQLCLTSDAPGSPSTSQAILPCDRVQGTWCCSDTGPCCDNATIKSPPLGTLVIPSQVTSTISQTATVALATVTLAPSTPPLGCPFCNCVPIGVGVGVPLTFLGCVAATYAFWLYRALYHPTAQQRLAQQSVRKMSSGESGAVRHDSKDDVTSETIPLQEVDTEEIEELHELKQ